MTLENVDVNPRRQEAGRIREMAPFWLGDLDSNQGFPSQSRKFYR